ncbi:hypothetical protein BGX31_009143, partial [Mortierella sp. GBA43]
FQSLAKNNSPHMQEITFHTVNKCTDASRQDSHPIQGSYVRKVMGAEDRTTPHQATCSGNRVQTREIIKVESLLYIPTATMWPGLGAHSTLNY